MNSAEAQSTALDLIISTSSHFSVRDNSPVGFLEDDLSFIIQGASTSKPSPPHRGCSLYSLSQHCELTIVSRKRSGVTAMRALNGIVTPLSLDDASAQPLLGSIVRVAHLFSDTPVRRDCKKASLALPITLFALGHPHITVASAFLSVTAASPSQRVLDVCTAHSPTFTTNAQPTIPLSAICEPHTIIPGVKIQWAPHYGRWERIIFINGRRSTARGPAGMILWVDVAPPCHHQAITPAGVIPPPAVLYAIRMCFTPRSAPQMGPSMSTALTAPTIGVSTTSCGEMALLDVVQASGADEAYTSDGSDTDPRPSSPVPTVSSMLRAGVVQRRQARTALPFNQHRTDKTPAPTSNSPSFDAGLSAKGGIHRPYTSLTGRKHSLASHMVTATRGAARHTNGRAFSAGLSGSGIRRMQHLMQQHVVLTREHVVQAVVIGQWACKLIICTTPLHPAAHNYHSTAQHSTTLMPVTSNEVPPDILIPNDDEMFNGSPPPCTKPHPTPTEAAAAPAGTATTPSHPQRVVVFRKRHRTQPPPPPPTAKHPLCEGQKRLLIAIDQHAAHERILFEQFMDSLHGNVLAVLQRPPLRVSISDITVLAQLLTMEADTQALLRQWHFTYTIQQLAAPAAVVIVSCLPRIFGTTPSPPDAIGDIILKRHVGSVPAFVDAIVASKACRSAVMFGRLLSKQQCEDIVRDLALTRSCFTCAHGRPTSLPISSICLTHGMACEGP